MAGKVSRRSFTQATGALVGLAAAAPSAASYARIVGANERVRLGFIGVANRGGQLMDAFAEHDDTEVLALCDVDARTLRRSLEKAEQQPNASSDIASVKDFRRVLDRGDIDAVVIATPDHWHAIQTTMACDAGKDVYVEKPLSITVVEGRRMVQSARRNQRVVQVGTHRRSSTLYAELARRTTADEFGKICLSRAYRVSNMFPAGIGKQAPQAPPAELDWDMWLGPRPRRPFQETIAPYRFRWWHLYSSQMANWGVHYLDAIRWCTGELAPASVCAMGGKFVVDDDRTVPDTMEVTFQFASGRLAVFGQYESSGNAVLPQGEIEFRGTLGTVLVNANSYKVVPERGGQFQDRQPRSEPEEVEASGGNANLTAAHARNFLDCVRSREKPHADVEVGHRSTTFSLIANISLMVGKRLEWDAEKEQFVNDDQANQLLHYEYREPWKLT
jgi:predicted dehydrogenase